MCGAPGPERVMTLDPVLDFLDIVDGLAAHVWLDGGWAVDVHGPAENDDRYPASALANTASR